MTVPLTTTRYAVFACVLAFLGYLIWAMYYEPVALNAPVRLAKGAKQTLEFETALSAQYDVAIGVVPGENSQAEDTSIHCLLVDKAASWCKNAEQPRLNVEWSVSSASGSIASGRSRESDSVLIDPGRSVSRKLGSFSAQQGKNYRIEFQSHADNESLNDLGAFLVVRPEPHRNAGSWFWTILQALTVLAIGLVLLWTLSTRVPRATTVAAADSQALGSAPGPETEVVTSPNTFAVGTGLVGLLIVVLLNAAVCTVLWAFAVPGSGGVGGFFGYLTRVFLAVNLCTAVGSLILGMVGRWAAAYLMAVLTVPISIGIAYAYRFFG